MTNMETVLPKPRLICLYILLFLCLIIMLFGILRSSEALKYRFWGQEAQAKVLVSVEASDERFVNVEYEIFGVIYKGNIQNPFNTYKKGDLITIWCDSDNPTKFIKFPDYIYISLIPLITGVVTSFIFLRKLSQYYTEKKRISRLINHENPIEAIIIDVIKVPEKIIFGVMPIIIKAQSSDIVFTSKLIYFDIDQENSLLNHYITVHQNARPNDDYYVDISSIHK